MGDRPTLIQVRTVIGFGRASFVEDEAEKGRALDLIVSRFTERKFDYPAEKLGITPGMKVLDLG